MARKQKPTPKLDSQDVIDWLRQLNGTASQLAFNAELLCEKVMKRGAMKDDIEFLVTVEIVRREIADLKALSPDD